MEFFLYTLPNGIRCIHKRTKSPVAYCALTVNAGSRDECNNEQGIAHLTEHTIFKGTQHRKAHHINSRLERLGGELNAFTTKEETVVHATVLKGDFAKAVELIADICFHSTFPEKEVEREREIVLDEINSYKDSPAERIYDEFEDLLFAKSALGHNILGDKKSVSCLTSNHIRDFVNRSYNTDEMVFSSIGNISESSFKRIVDSYFAQAPQSSRQSKRLATGESLPFKSEINRNTHQAHCIIGCRAYTLNEDKRTTLSLLTNILGGPAANSLLNISIREKYGLSYSVEASYTPFTDAGVASIYFGTDKDNTDLCQELVNTQLRQLMSGALSTRQISMAKKQFIGQMTIAMESDESYMLGAAKSYLIYNDLDTNEAIYKKIMGITSKDIVDVANEIFSNTSTLIFK